MKAKAFPQVRVHPELYKRIKTLSRAYRMQSITGLVDELLSRALDIVEARKTK